jgi:hypothetical protein
MWGQHRWAPLDAVQLGLDVQLREPLEPAREVPVPSRRLIAAEQDAADDRRVEQYGDREADPSA